MSGHSRFASIKHKKEKDNAAKDKVFTVIGRKIAVAVKEGGSDPTNNSKPRDAIAKAEASNAPNDTINNGIKEATGGLNSVNYKQNVYEGHGPSGVMIIVRTLTDNKNHAAANVRAAFSRGGGNVGTPGCVSFMFGHKRQIIIDKGECEMDPDELVMFALDADAGGFADNEDSYEVLADPEQFSAVHETFEQKGVSMLEAGVKIIPQNWVSSKSEGDRKKMQRILDLLDENDDIRTVFYNWDGG